MGGHQIGGSSILVLSSHVYHLKFSHKVHTWSHPSLTTLTNEEIIAELGWAKQVIHDILGVTPNMMRCDAKPLDFL
jgi:hypothetical protein